MKYLFLNGLSNNHYERVKRLELLMEKTDRLNQDTYNNMKKVGQTIKNSFYGDFDTAYTYINGDLSVLGSKLDDPEGLSKTIGYTGYIIDFLPNQFIAILDSNGILYLRSIQGIKNTGSRMIGTDKIVHEKNFYNGSIIGNVANKTEKNTIDNNLSDSVVLKGTNFTPFTLIRYGNKFYTVVSRETLNDEIVQFAISNKDPSAKGVSTSGFSPTLPIGSPYYQIVGEHPEPQVLYPNTVWEKLYDGESVTVSTDGILAQENRLANGIQLDTQQRITGSLIVNIAGRFVRLADGGGSSYADNTGGGTISNVGSDSGQSRWNIDSSRQVRTSSVNKMRNVLWNMWIRRA